MISVVIPAYNAEEYLRECLESVMAQTYGDWEAVVVDDESTDRTVEVAMESVRLAPRIRVVSIRHGGPSAARNAGVRESRGEYVTFLDSDDCLYPGALRALADGSEGVDVVCGGIVTGRSFRPGGGGGPAPGRRVMTGTEALETGLYQKDIVTSACGKLYGRDLFGKELFAEGLTYEDLDFYARVMAVAGKVAVIGDDVYFYRRNPRSFINTFGPARLDVLKVTAGIERMVAERFPELLPAARDRRLSASFNMYALIGLHDPTGRYDEARRGCWRCVRDYRRECLLNPKVRLKNKAGALASYLGGRVFMLFAKMVYR